MVHTCISRYKQTELEYPVSTFQDAHIGGSRTIVAEGPWCFSVDLKDAYWYVSINKNFQQYLGFMFKGQVYCFVALPYGLNIAPRIFTLIMKDFLGWASRRGMVCAIYLDDLLSDGAHPGYLTIMESNHSGRTATERSFYQLGEVDAHTFSKVCISREAVNNGSPTSMPNSGQCHRYNSRNSQNSSGSVGVPEFSIRSPWKVKLCSIGSYRTEVVQWLAFRLSV